MFFTFVIHTVLEVSTHVNRLPSEYVYLTMDGNFKTVLMGASLKPYRYSHRAVKILRLNGYEVVPVGLRNGEIEGTEILTGRPEIQDVHTITMYMNVARQVDLYDYLLSLKPVRIIFNPGAENPELTKLAREHGIHCENACTLVLLSIGEFENIPA